LEDVIKNSKAFEHAFAIPESEAEFACWKGAAPIRVKIVQSSKRGLEDVCCHSKNGLVTAVVEAYNTHHELVLRPDDFWQAIVTQFSFYVQAHAEELRDRLVDFNGKRQLTVNTVGTLFTADFGDTATRMVDEQIIHNIKDPSIAAWLLPSFSTTEPNDRVVAAVSVMATLQAYFDYKICLCCGLPRVTLLGTPRDWEALRAKLDRLLEFDLEQKCMQEWYNMLVPVVDELVQSAQGRPDVRGFWDRICSHIGGGSGPRYLSGWITVFAAFTRKGAWQGSVRSMHENGRGTVQSDWPIIDTNDLPIGALSVPVLVDDNGTEYNAQMLAGQFSFDIVSDGIGIQPRSDWCIAIPQSAAYCSSAAGPEESMPLLQDPRAEDVVDDLPNERQCLLFPELEPPVSV